MEDIVFQKDEFLSRHTTFKIGGSADFFVEAESEEELQNALEWARENSQPLLILGGGSNILVSDKGWRGMVVKIKINHSKIIREDENQVFLEIGAGMPLMKLVLDVTQKGWPDLKWAAGIPGLLGGAVYGNAGAYGHSISESVEEVRVINKESKEKKILSNKECAFIYRGSFFKSNDWIITSILMRFNKNGEDGGMEEIKERIILRNKKTPPYPSAGSVFKNIIVADLTKNQAEQIPSEIIKGGKMPAGWLIEQCGLKGREIGGARVSLLHGNYIVNFKQAKSSDVIELIDICKKNVAEKFGIKLEEEIKLIGF